MKNLIIIGAGDVAGFIVNNMDLFSERYNIIGLLDDDPKKINKFFWGYQVIGNVSAIEKFENCSIVVCISNPLIKKKILDRFRKDFDFPNFISHKAWLSNTLKLGKGIIIYPNVSINYETTVGDFSIVNMNCAIGHNVQLGMGASLAPGVNLAGNTLVEDFVEIGIGASTVQQIKLNDNSVIGGQTMVLKDVPSGATVVGNPGKVIKR